MKTLDQRIADAEDKAARYLADYNVEASEAKRAKLLERSQYWLDRANELRGWA